MCHIKNLQQFVQTEAPAIEQDFTNWFLSIDSNLSPLEPEEPVFPITTISSVASSPSMEYFTNSNLAVEDYNFHSPESISIAKEDDNLAKKRKKVRNDNKQNEAAKRCRKKKQSQMKETHDSIRNLEDEKFQLKMHVAVLEKERQAFLSRESDMQSEIQSLKKQLDESQKLLLALANK